ncbi:MAG: hypothetical protein IJN97_04170 [Oscillospiraceae bacterium]|nr:hypothetical protein [Oscillospiraceae bacterium]
MYLKRTTFLLLTIVFISLMMFCFTWGVLLDGNFAKNPSEPEIVYYEFPICLEYEIDGEYIKNEDVLVCKFDGFGFNEGNGKFRKWTAYLKSGKSRITLFKENGVEIYYFPIKEDSRLPGVFMGDREFYNGGTGGTFPDAWVTINYEDRTVNDYLIGKDELWTNYKIRLISWECAPPIKNTFK